MKKIPTVFERDWEGDRSRVLPQIHAGCEWVLAGEGVTTQKLDGTCCMIRDGRLYRRQEIKRGRAVPIGFELADIDVETGKTVGWMPVGDGAEDQWHRAGFDALYDKANGTYELVGPKVQDNAEGWAHHSLIPHTVAYLSLTEQPPRDFDGLRAWLARHDVEGVVFHHPDGRMAKIKGRDFRLKRRPQ